MLLNMLSEEGPLLWLRPDENHEWAAFVSCACDVSGIVVFLSVSFGLVKPRERQISIYAYCNRSQALPRERVLSPYLTNVS